MRCPYCSFEDSKVIESRGAEDGSRIRRRRECEECSKRFTTYEVVEKLPVMVVKRSGIREQFDRKKVFDGLLKSCEKRAIPLDQIEKMADEVETKVQNSLDKEISSLAVGEYSMEALRQVDEVAYIRFAAVYRQFRDIKDLMKELENFLGKK